MKIRPVGAKLFHGDGQTDRHYEANRRFSQFCERAQNFTFITHSAPKLNAETVLLKQVVTAAVTSTVQNVIRNT